MLLGDKELAEKLEFIRAVLQPDEEALNHFKESRSACYERLGIFSGEHLSYFTEQIDVFNDFQKRTGFFQTPSDMECFQGIQNILLRQRNAFIQGLNSLLASTTQECYSFRWRFLSDMEHLNSEGKELVDEMIRRNPGAHNLHQLRALSAILEGKEGDTLKVIKAVADKLEWHDIANVAYDLKCRADRKRKAELMELGRITDPLTDSWYGHLERIIEPWTSRRIPSKQEKYWSATILNKWMHGREIYRVERYIPSASPVDRHIRWDFEIRRPEYPSDYWTYPQLAEIQLRLLFTNGSPEEALSKAFPPSEACTFSYTGSEPGPLDKKVIGDFAPIKIWRAMHFN